MEKMRELAGTILAEAAALGADMAQCTVRETEKREFNIDSGEFSLMRTLFDRSVSVRVFLGGRQGAVTINSFAPETVKKAVRDAVEAAQSASPDPAWEIDRSGTVRVYDEGVPEGDAEQLFARTKELLEETGRRWPNILMEQVIAEHDRIRSIYLNSFGTEVRRNAGIYGVYAMYNARGEKGGSNSYGSSFMTVRLDAPFLSCAMMERDLADTAKMADPEPLTEKFTGTVLMRPDCAADVVFGTILGSFVSDLSLIDGSSTWKDKLGQKVADERITLSLRPHDPRILLGERCTQEGFAAEDFDVIRDGVLERFALSQYAANKTGNRRGGCGTDALVVPAGTTPLEEIIRGIDRGIFMGRFSGGSPGANGEFSGVAKNSFLIENGRITKPLSETMVSANLLEMLFHVRAVSCETLDDGSSSVPFIAFDGVTVSGR